MQKLAFFLLMAGFAFGLVIAMIGKLAMKYPGQTANMSSLLMQMFRRR